jgi:thiosulfate/3-mercaptopyruvate sulfurtransferase
MPKRRWLVATFSSALLFAICVFPALEKISARALAASDPWTAAQTVDAPSLARELSDAPADRKPVVICVGFHSLYHGAHILAATYHGPGSTPEGLADLKKFAQSLPRSADVVLYCGCCPLDHCPNIRPAFEALRDAGFARLRVLLLPTDFASDWVVKGYPVAKGD